MNKSNISILDVTLRDGGCVNNFNFGEENINRILRALETTGVEYIELGYLDDKKGSVSGRTQFLNEQVVYQTILKYKKPNIKYVVMMDYGKFDVNNLEQRNDKSIDGIRLAFHKRDAYKALDLGKIILNKGYKLFLQPMLTITYTDQELVEIIEKINKELPETSALYIVDSFGQMKPEDVMRLSSLVDRNLDQNIIMGFHSHNNLQLAFANSLVFYNPTLSRELMLDSSVYGMGKGAGNLNTELIFDYLNNTAGKNYQTQNIYSIIDDIISQEKKKNAWGYSIEYYLASKNQCTPSYINYFTKNAKLTTEQLDYLLSLIPNEKKVAFDGVLAESILNSFSKIKL